MPLPLPSAVNLFQFAFGNVGKEMDGGPHGQIAIVVSCNVACMERLSVAPRGQEAQDRDETGER